MFDILNTLFRYKDKKSPDELGSYPIKVHVEAFAERRYLWTSRLLVILAGLSICFNMILVLTIYLLIPSIKVQPQFFNINKYFSQIERVQPHILQYPVPDLITEQYIRQYIYMRYTMGNDAATLAEQWRAGSPLFWYSAPTVYSDFQSGEMQANISSFKKGMRRAVVIQWIKPMARGLWQTQFATVETSPGKDPSIVYWRATIRVAYTALQFPNKEDKILNPYGFIVVSYSLSYHGTEGDKETYIDAAKRKASGQ